MPRHRKAHVPRHGAPRHIDSSTRRAQLPAAPADPPQQPLAFVPLGGDEPETLDFLASSRDQSGYQPRLRRGVIGDRLRSLRTSLRLRRARAAGPAIGRPILRGAARSLLVTPWFAAGAGIVLAAGLWIYSPHTELKFPATATSPAELPCAPPGCGAGPVRHSAGHLAASKPSVRMRHWDGRRRAAADISFRFTVLWQHSDMFGALVSVTGPHLPRSWRLAFALPGADIGHVLGALWHPAAGRPGGTASSLGPGKSLGDGWQQGGSAGRGSQEGGGPDSISFLVFGTGTPGTPTGCLFNRAICRFG